MQLNIKNKQLYQKMSRRPKQMFLQKKKKKKNTDGQKAYEKMLNTAIYQRSANQNYNEDVRMAIIQKPTDSKC